ncbi:MAG: aspartate dehydrogenase [Pseudomonadota bacterium]
MFQITIIGCGAIAEYVAGHLKNSDDIEIVSALVTVRSLERARTVFGSDVSLTTEYSTDSPRADLVVDCAGHAGLRQHGEKILAYGVDVVSVSVGAMADESLAAKLSDAATSGGSQLHLASGAIGALDALSAAQVGGLDEVVYTGRKPPAGWRGSPAEETLALDELSESAVHFSGSARDAALRYPKNANVAAAVALAGIGFDKTRVELIADPTINTNRHEVSAKGAFGKLNFSIEGNALPDNPKSSALAAMSVVRAVLDRAAPVRVG